MKLKPESGKTPADYLLEEEKNDLQQVNAAVDLSSYKSSDCYIKCPGLDGYLAATRDSWLGISPKKYRWKAYWKSGKGSGPFALQSRDKPYKRFYVGHQKGSDCAGVYDSWYPGSDWLEMDGKKLLNNNDDDRFLGKHTNGYFYWINRTEERSSDYEMIDCVFEDV